MRNHHFDKFVPDICLDDQSRTRGTGLTTVIEHGDRGKQRSLFQVRIREYDVRALAAKFQEGTLQIRLSRILHELLADFGRASKCQSIDIIVQREVPTKASSRTWQHMQDAVGQARLTGKSRNAQR